MQLRFAYLTLCVCIFILSCQSSRLIKTVSPLYFQGQYCIPSDHTFLGLASVELHRLDNVHFSKIINIYKTQSDERGAFKFEHVDEGRYNLIVKKNELFFTERLDITAEHQTFNQDIGTCRPAVGQIDGRLCDHLSHQFFNHATLTIEDAGVLYETQTDEYGFFKFEQIPAGLQQIKVVGSNEGQVAVRVKPLVDGVTTFGLTESCVSSEKTRLEGSICFNNKDTPLPGASVRLEHAGSFFYAQTDNHGFFSLSGMSEGDFLVKVNKGLLTHTFQVSLYSGKSLKLTNPICVEAKQSLGKQRIAVVTGAQDQVQSIYLKWGLSEQITELQGCVCDDLSSDASCRFCLPAIAGSQRGGRFVIPALLALDWVSHKREIDNYAMLILNSGTLLEHMCVPDDCAYADWSDARCRASMRNCDSHSPIWQAHALILESYVRQGGRLYFSGSTVQWLPAKWLQSVLLPAQMAGVLELGLGRQKIQNWSFVSPVFFNILNSASILMPVHPFVFMDSVNFPATPYLQTSIRDIYSKLHENAVLAARIDVAPTEVSKIGFIIFNGLTQDPTLKLSEVDSLVESLLMQ